MIIEICDHIEGYPYPEHITWDPLVSLDFSVKEISPGKLDIALTSAWCGDGYLDKTLIPEKELDRLMELAKSKYLENWTVSKRYIE